MKKYFNTFLVIALLTIQSFADEKPTEPFSDSETNFKLVMQKLLDKYLDKNISKDNLYRAATAGMLSSLNSGEEKYNTLLSPQDLKNMESDLSGKIMGIGVVIKFDERTGYGHVIKSTPGSAAEKAGLKSDDQVLSVDGKKFKGKQFLDLVSSIRGEVGKAVEIKILREDKIITVNIKREIIPWTPVEMEKIDEATNLLTIGFFNEQTPKLVEDKLNEVNSHKVKKLIIDVRSNEGGGFDQAVKVAELFLPEGTIIANTKNRAGKVEKYKSGKNLLSQNIQIILLTNKDTRSGAELFVAALKENRPVKLVGETTFGKWNAQTVETLPNKYAIKYTVKEFQSPKGNSFQGLGIKPDLEVGLPKDTDIKELQAKFEISKRISLDSQLKAALELIKAI